MSSINLNQKFQNINAYWTPKILGEVNDSCIKIAKFKGEFEWHHHDDADEMFLVTKGAITIKLENEDIHLKVGECYIVPKGVVHKPVAEKEAHILLVEKRSTLNTGNVENHLTHHNLETI